MNAGSLVESGAGEDIDSARQIVSAALAMNRMVSNLLDISHSERGELKPTFTRVDLAALAAELVRAQAVRDPRQTLDVHAAPVVIEADAELIRRVLENLVDNARKYSQSHKPIRVEIELVDLSWVELRVRDSGPGVPVALREKIFDKYARLDSDTDEHLDTSRGLGLTFCRLAAQAHHGRIWVDENLPRGSVFHVRLPVSRDVVE
jgi:two-component system sensor histidine kinase/response regulator